jgi:hypothetical protein
MSYLLDFKGPIEGYVVNYIKRHGWKVESTQTRDDLLQEAYLVYMKIGRKYPDLKDPPHFMALFKTAWSRRFTELANEDTASRVLTQLVTRNEEGEEAVLDPVGDADNDGALAVMIRQAPREVTAVLNLFLSAPQEIMELALAAWTGPDKRKRAGGSERINRMLGLPLHVDAMQGVRDYFH